MSETASISMNSRLSSVYSTHSHHSHHSKHSKQSHNSQSCKLCASSRNNKKHERSKAGLDSAVMNNFIGVERAIADKSKVNFHHNKLDSVDDDIVLKEYKLDDKGTTIGILPWKGM